MTTTESLKACEVLITNGSRVALETERKIKEWLAIPENAERWNQIQAAAQHEQRREDRERMRRNLARETPERREHRLRVQAEWRAKERLLSA